MIPFYSFKYIHDTIEDQLIESSIKTIKSGNYVFGTARFEEEFADYVGSKYCAAVANGTAAIHLSLLALGIQEGDEVITVSHTFRATVAAIKYCGAIPIYVDIRDDTFVIDHNSLESKITDKTKCIIPVHIYGNVAAMKEIKRIADKYNIPIVEDCSQAHGSKIHDQHVGTFGTLGTFSFYPGKGLGALGDAGCVVTNDENLYKFITKMRQWDDNAIGYNYRMSNIQAEFLRIKLKTFDTILFEKRQIADEYNKHFPYVKCDTGVFHSYHVYPILVSERDKFIEILKSQVEIKSHYNIPVHRLTCYRSSVSLPITEKISNHEVSLPIYPGVDSEKVITHIENILNDNTCSLL